MSPSCGRMAAARGRRNGGNKNTSSSFLQRPTKDPCCAKRSTFYLQKPEEAENIKAVAHCHLETSAGIIYLGSKLKAFIVKELQEGHKYVPLGFDKLFDDFSL